MNGWQPADDFTTVFLREFVRNSDAPGDAAAGQFADTFLVADPQRALTVPREAFVKSLPLRRKLFADADVGAPQLVRAEQLDLDPLHKLIRTSWRAPRTDRPDVILESTFLVRRTEPAQILVYLNHKDLAELLAE